MTLSVIRSIRPLPNQPSTAWVALPRFIAEQFVVVDEFQVTRVTKLQSPLGSTFLSDRPRNPSSAPKCDKAASDGDRLSERTFVKIKQRICFDGLEILKLKRMWQRSTSNSHAELR